MSDDGAACCNLRLSSRRQDFEIAERGRFECAGEDGSGEGGGGREPSWSLGWESQKSFSRPDPGLSDGIGCAPAGVGERFPPCPETPRWTWRNVKSRRRLVGRAGPPYRMELANSWNFLLVLLLFLLGAKAVDLPCPQNEVRDSSGICVCADGFFLNVNDLCRPVAECRFGHYCDDNGREKLCPEGMWVWSEGSTSRDQCSCIEDDLYFNLDGVCAVKSQCPAHHDCYTGGVPIRHRLSLDYMPGVKMSTRYGVIEARSGGVAGVAFDRQPSVQGIGNWRSAGSFYSFVTVILDNNPGCGDLMGNVTAPLVGGVATFTDLRLNSPGRGVVFRFCAGECFRGERPVLDVVSRPFNIRPGRLLVVTEPGKVISGEVLGVQPVIKAQVMPLPLPLPLPLLLSL